jgi:formate-dependent nitrite reductase membrane component NrfD
MDDIQRGFLCNRTLKRSPSRRRGSVLGRIMSALPALFLLVDGAMKLVKPEVVVKTTVELGYGETVILPLGVVLLACTILYLIPRGRMLPRRQAYRPSRLGSSSRRS